MFKYTLPLMLVIVLTLIPDCLVAGQYHALRPLSSTKPSPSPKPSSSQRPSYPTKPSSGESGTINEEYCALRSRMSKLWTDHVWWTRQAIISSVAGLKDIDAITQRLLQNQDEIGSAIAPFYGEQNGKAFATLLKKHITIYVDLIHAALAHRRDEVNNFYTQWEANASDIGTFLSKANPYWNQQELTNMFNEHLRLTAMELQLRMNGNWTADVTNFDQIFKQALIMARSLADGIVNQFRTQF